MKWKEYIKKQKESGKKGGKNRWAKMTEKEKLAFKKKMSEAMKAYHKKKKVSENIKRMWKHD